MTRLEKKMFSAAVLSALLTGYSFAGNLSAPIGLSNAKVLPKGVRNVSIKGVIASGQEKYGSAGNQTILADPLFTELTFQNLLDGNESNKERAEIKAAMAQAGASLDDSLGTTTGQINLKANVTVPVFAFGLTEKLTGAIAIPVVRTSLNVSTGVVHTNEALFNKLLTNLEDAGATVKKADLIDKLNRPVARKLEDKNYQPLRNETKTQLGDIKLVGKYQAFSNRLNAVVLSGILTLPTGKDADPNKIVDLPSGDRQTDIGVGVNYDYYFGSRTTFSFAAEHTVQLSDIAEKRVPFWRGSAVTPYIDYAVNRDLGDISKAQLSGLYNLRGVNFGLGYEISYKQADKYSGDKYESEWYQNIGKDTVQRMQAATITIGYDTLTLFKEGKFKAPLSLLLTHSRLIDGKNVVKDPVTTIDFNLFF